MCDKNIGLSGMGLELPQRVDGDSKRKTRQSGHFVLLEDRSTVVDIWCSISYFRYICCFLSKKKILFEKLKN